MVYDSMVASKKRPETREGLPAWSVALRMRQSRFYSYFNFMLM